MSLTTRDLSPAIGSEVIADAASLLSGGLAAEIKAKLTERGVLLFRDVHFDDEELNMFAASISPSPCRAAPSPPSRASPARAT